MVLLYHFCMEKLSEKLPAEFLLRQKEQLGGKFDDYLKAMDEPSVRGVRINTTKISVDECVKIFENELNTKLSKIDYSRDGFVLNSTEKFGNEASHLAGLYYFQEPSSMVAVIASNIENENRPVKVLDLCASPGGKTGQIACRVSEDSLIVSNEIISSLSVYLVFKQSNPLAPILCKKLSKLFSAKTSKSNNLDFNKLVKSLTTKSPNIILQQSNKLRIKM